MKGFLSGPYKSHGSLYLNVETLFRLAFDCIL
jgi:hypothetical protein